MKRLGLVLPAILLMAAQTSPPKNGVIHPGPNVDPNMRVIPPHTPTRTPVVRPPGRPHSEGGNGGTVIVPK